jgi:hypothetical protein
MVWRRRFGAAAMVLVFAATTAGACTDEFDSCKETRTCQPGQTDGGAAGTALKAGIEVKKKRAAAATTSEYVLKCGAGASAPAAPTCNGDGDMCGNGDNMAEARM